jgi:hypothetical protein
MIVVLDDLQHIENQIMLVKQILIVEQQHHQLQITQLMQIRIE